MYDSPYSRSRVGASTLAGGQQHAVEEHHRKIYGVDLSPISFRNSKAIAFLPAQSRRACTSNMTTAHDVSSDGLHLTFDVMQQSGSARSAGIASTSRHSEHSLIEARSRLSDTLNAHHLLPALGMQGKSLLEVLMQVDEKNLLVHQRGIAHGTTVPSDPDGAALPCLMSVSPVCLSPMNAAPATEVLLTGLNLQAPGAYVRARYQGNFLSVHCGSVDEVGSSPGAVAGQQCLSAWLADVPASGGLILVELQCGSTLSSWKPIAVVPDACVAKEVTTMQVSLPPSGADFFVADLGRWLDYVSCVARPAGAPSSACHSKTSGNSPATVPAAPPAAADMHGMPSFVQYCANAFAYRTALTEAVPRVQMLSTGLQLLEAAADHGWPCTCSFLLETLLSVGVEYDWVVDMISTRGPSLLLRAVRSRNADAVYNIVRLGETHKRPWRWESADVHGITPLHVAAVLQDGGSMAHCIIRTYPSAVRSWQTAQAFDGLTPADCAAKAGRSALNEVVQARLKELASPFQSQEGEGQRLVQDLPPEALEQLRLLTAAHAQSASNASSCSVAKGGEVASSSSSSSSSSVSRMVVGGRIGASVAARSTTPCTAGALLQCCLAGRFEQPSLEVKFGTFRKMRSLQSDYLQPVLAFLVAFSMAVTHTKQGGGMLALFTLLLSLVGQLILPYTLVTHPAYYLENRSYLWIATQLVQPALLVLAVLGLLPLPLSWTYSPPVIMAVHAVMTSYIEQLSVPSAAMLRLAGVGSHILAFCLVPVGEVRSILQRVATTMASAACGMAVTIVLDLKNRFEFLNGVSNDK